MKLCFKVKEFRKGKNLTVRKGNYWMNKKASNFDIIKTISCRFRDIPRDLLKYEHDAKCRNYDGLLREMKHIYKGFTANHIVTLVFFRQKNAA